MVKIVLGENSFETDLEPSPALDHWFHLWLVAQDAIPAQQAMLDTLVDRIRVSTDQLQATITEVSHA
jgi:hypothetical protein